MTGIENEVNAERTTINSLYSNFPVGSKMLLLFGSRIDKIPRKFLPFRASVHVLAASYNEARSSVMLYFFLSFLATKYIAAAPAYFTANRSV